MDRLVRAAQRMVAWARVVESLLVGSAALLAVLAAAAHQGLRIMEPGVFAAAGLAALGAAGAWWGGCRPRLGGVARVLDDRLRQSGALETAFECAGAVAQGAVQPALPELLARNVLRNLNWGRVLREACPNSVPLIALPLLAGALLLGARRGQSQVGAEFALLTQLSIRVAADIAHAQDDAKKAWEAGEIDAGELGKLQSLRQDVNAAQHSLNGARPSAAAKEIADEVGRIMAAARDQMLETARSQQPTSDLAQSLAQAAAAADAAAQATGGDQAAALGAGRMEGGDARSTGAGAIDDPDPQGHSDEGQNPMGDPADGERGGTGEALSAESGAPGTGEPGAAEGQNHGEAGTRDVGASRNGAPTLANGNEHGTIPGQNGPGESSGGGDSPGPSGSDTAPMATDPSGPTADIAARGVGGGRWWPERHAELVGRWVEARRAASAAAGERRAESGPSKDTDSR